LFFGGEIAGIPGIYGIAGIPGIYGIAGMSETMCFLDGVGE
jgi:hypothetical protein